MKRTVEFLNQEFHNLMEENDNVVLLGEDILDPYGGAFKVYSGLSSKFPERVLTTPISEAGMTGIGIGLALNGFVPVVEIMFGDFVTLIADQLINHAAKMTHMYNQPLKVPLVVRTPMGGRRGYGPTHSQSLEKLFLGVPGLRVIAMSNIMNPGLLLNKAVLETPEPVLFVENKSLYSMPVENSQSLESRGWGYRTTDNNFPAVTMHQDSNPDITFVTYGGMVPLVLEACETLKEQEELSCEVVILHELCPLHMDPIIDSVKASRRTVIVEEGWTQWGWGSEVVSMLATIRQDAPPARIGSKSLAIPAARSLENAVLPQVDDIVRAGIRIVDHEY